MEHTESLDERIKRRYEIAYKELETDVKPISDYILLDGIINENEYHKSTKILWVLWEPYDKGGWEEYEWDTRKWINDSPFNSPTWKNISYTSYGILNNLSYEEIRNNLDLQEILKVQRRIAYINVSKFPAETTSRDRWSFLKAVYDKCNPELLEQIHTYNPDIIIGGNSLYLFQNDLGLNKNSLAKIPFSRSIWEKDSKLFIDAHHPSRMGKSYCEEIIAAALEWKNKHIN